MSNADRSSLKVILIGFGNVGKKLAEILTEEKKNFLNLSGLKPEVLGIFTKHHGSLVNRNGIDLKDALNHFKENNGFAESYKDYTNADAMSGAAERDYDVLIELSTLSIKEKGEPAASYIREALKRGKHAVTANKGPAAFYFRELKELAEKNGGVFLHESAVMDGAPVFNLAKSTLKGCRITEVSGILNSTTNFIISRMEGGKTFGSALKEAKTLGFAESDPDYDIDGWDAAAKTAVLANALLGASVTPYDVPREGIRDITDDQIQSVIERDYRLRLVCRAWLDDGVIKTRVAVEEVPADHPFAGVNGSGSIIRIVTDIMTPILITQESPGLYDTAYGVINDLMTIANGGAASR